jgi:cephalosporin-C deacetylase-like acetyl esterase
MKLGSYQIETFISAGGMGQVYRARDTRLDRPVAIKLIRNDLLGRTDFHRRFQREARAISALNHPHICSLYDIGDQDGMTYLVMEYIEGVSLATTLANASLPVETAIEYAVQITSALAAAHAPGLFGPVRFYADQARTDKPIDDAAFRIYAGLNTYDKTDLNAILQSVDDSSPQMRVETVTFDAGYAGERVTAHLFLPRNARPPYQVVIYFGTLDALTQKSVKSLRDPFQFVVRSGRAMLIPAFKGTLERSLPAQQVQILTTGTVVPGSAPQRQRELLLAWPKDLSRSIDYLETRSDIDTSKVAFYGMSYGAINAPRLIALEPRVKAAVLHTAGTTVPMAPEIDPWNYAPRVTIPVLMVNGRNDEVLPVETRQLPLFRALGTPEKDKRHILVDGSHTNVMTQPRLMKEILDWFDRYLGAVQAK